MSGQTALVSGAVALVVGTWAALAAREVPPWLRRFTDAVFHLPMAVPSIASGLGLLIAFNEDPLLPTVTLLALVVLGRIRGRAAVR